MADTSSKKIDLDPLVEMAKKKRLREHKASGQAGKRRKANKKENVRLNVEMFFSEYGDPDYDLDHLKAMLSKGMDPDHSDGEYRTCLMYACFTRRPGAVLALIDSGAMVNVTSDEAIGDQLQTLYMSALTAAVINHVGKEAVEKILSVKPIMTGQLVRCGVLPCVKPFVTIGLDGTMAEERMLDISQNHMDGWRSNVVRVPSALECVVVMKKSVRKLYLPMLLQAGATIDTKLALVNIAKFCDLDELREVYMPLAESKFEFNKLNIELLCAVTSDRVSPETIKELVKAGADIHAGDGYGNSLLHCILGTDRTMHRNDFDTERSSARPITFMRAPTFDDEKPQYSLDFLCDVHKNVRAKSWVLLMRNVKLLVKLGLDPNAVDRQRGWSVLEYAKKLMPSESSEYHALEKALGLEKK